MDDRRKITAGVAVLEAACLWYEAVREEDDHAMDVAIAALLETVPRYQKIKEKELHDA